MPTSRSRSRSYSPPTKRKKSHQKKKSRSPCPDEAHYSGKHNHHRKDRSKQNNEASHRDREERKHQDHHQRHKQHRGSNEDELSSRRIKAEPEDRGYDHHNKRGAHQQQQQQHRDHNRERSHQHHHHSDRHQGNERDQRNDSREHYDRRRQNDHRRKMREVKTEPGTDGAKQQWGKKGENSRNNQDSKTVEKEKPDFGLSGKLTEDTNTFRGVVIKYNEPPEARKPKKRWRWYPFKGEETLPVLHLHRQSAFLLGRDRKVADIPTDHPSCSKQHAVLQFRMVEFRREDGSIGRRVRPYIIDLGSANGTYLNNERIEAEKYFELKEKDVVKFGFSSREYVLLHDATDTTAVEEEDSE